MIVKHYVVTKYPGIYESEHVLGFDSREHAEAVARVVAVGGSKAEDYILEVDCVVPSILDADEWPGGGCDE